MDSSPLSPQVRPPHRSPPRASSTPRPILRSVLALTVLALSCQVGGLEGDGQLGVEVRQVPEFGEVVVSSVLHAVVRLEPGEPRLEVRGDRNLLPFVTTRIVDGRLFLGVDGSGIGPRLPLEVHLWTPSLLRLEVNAGAFAQVSGAFGAALRLDAHDAASLSASGDVRRLQVIASGAATLRATDLVAVSVELRATGRSEIDVCATDRLDASLSGTSGATYGCHPSTVQREVSAGSELRER